MLAASAGSQAPTTTRRSSAWRADSAEVNSPAAALERVQRDVGGRNLLGLRHPIAEVEQPAQAPVVDALSLLESLPIRHVCAHRRLVAPVTIPSFQGLSAREPYGLRRGVPAKVS